MRIRRSEIYKLEGIRVVITILVLRGGMTLDWGGLNIRANREREGKLTKWHGKRNFLEWKDLARKSTRNNRKVEKFNFEGTVEIRSKKRDGLGSGKDDRISCLF